MIGGTSTSWYLELPSDSSLQVQVFDLNLEFNGKITLYLLINPRYHSIPTYLSHDTLPYQQLPIHIGKILIQNQSSSDVNGLYSSNITMKRMAKAKTYTSNTMIIYYKLTLPRVVLRTQQ